jgi:nucleotide-binding universal stress UspA family protein
MFKHILLPTDGSRQSNKAVKAGIRLAQTLGACVTGYFAVELPWPA